MTRRDFIYEAMVAAGLRTELKLTVPIRRVMDRYAQCTPEQLRRFWWSIWPEAVKDFNGGGIQLECSGATREIRRSPGGRPIFTGLSAKAINLVLTDHIPVAWDNGRAPGGMSACMRDTASAWLRSGMRTPIKSRSFRSTPVCMSYCRSARRHFLWAARRGFNAASGNRESIGMQPAYGCFTTAQPFGNPLGTASAVCDHPRRQVGRP
jgi:hypothetical protein